MPYPFEYLRRRNWRTDTNFVFVVHRFKPEIDQFVEQMIKVAAERAAGLDTLTAKNATGMSEILEIILQRIAEARLVIGVLMEANANVYWELGTAMTWKPATQVMTIGRKKEEIEHLPLNVAEFRHVEIDLKDEGRVVDQLAEEIRAQLSRHRTVIDEAVLSGRNSLGPIELEVMNVYGGFSGHFALPLEIGWADFPHRIAMRNLCGLGLLALNTRPGDGITKELSYYWTPLGNRVLMLIGVILSSEVEKRLDQLQKEVPHILDWRGGYVFRPILEL